MTHQEMLDQVSDELRNTTITTKITRWLNMSQIEIATNHLFGHLNSYGTKVTTTSPDITLDSDFLWLKTIQIPVQNTTLVPGDERELAETYPSYRTQTGAVQKYYLNGSTLGLWQVPTAGITITYSYQRKPAKLLSDLSVTCELPEEWHPLVTQKATTKGYDYDGDKEAATRSQGLERALLIRLGTSVYRRPDETLVLGSPSSSGKLGRPRFPANYPTYWR